MSLSRRGKMTRLSDAGVHAPLVAGAVTVTMAVALLLASAWLMATTSWVPVEAPAYITRWWKLRPRRRYRPQAVHLPGDCPVRGLLSPGQTVASAAADSQVSGQWVN